MRHTPDTVPPTSGIRTNAHNLYSQAYRSIPADSLFPRLLRIYPEIDPALPSSLLPQLLLPDPSVFPAPDALRRSRRAFTLLFRFFQPVQPYHRYCPDIRFLPGIFSELFPEKPILRICIGYEKLTFSGCAKAYS